MIGTNLSHYLIEAELGRGGMGVVYRATDTTLDRVVALKILPASALSSEDDRARFYREAKAAAALNHPHIAQVYQIAEAVPEGGSTEEPRPFIAMEYIEGETLEDRIKQGPLKLDEAVRLTTQVADALQAAHEKQIVHRDIKTQNVMLTKKGEVKVLDFGLAQTSASTKLTRLGSTLGTVSYMSPEQTRGEPVDQRTDLWALGVVMYELIAGRLPFGGEYEQAVTYSILNEDPEPLTSLRTGVPMGLEWIVTKLLAKKAENRYQSAGDLMVDLRTVDLNATGMSRTVSTVSAPGASSAPGTSGASTPPRSETRGLFTFMHPAGWVGLILLVSMIAVLTSLLLIGPDIPVSSMKRLEQPLQIGKLIAALDISPHGDKVAIATDHIHLLDLKTGELRTYDASGVYIHLSFSADGSDLLITTAGSIEIMSVESGSVVDLLHPGEGGPRAEWIDSETIIYEEKSSFFSYSLTTSESHRLIELDSLASQYDLDYPTLLPDGETIMGVAQFTGEPDRIGFWNLKTGRNMGYLNIPAGRPRWIYPGYLVFVMKGDVMAMPFDTDRLEQTGPLVVLDEDIEAEGLSVSAEGTLVHVGLDVGIVANAAPINPMITRMKDGSMFIDSPLNLFPSARYRTAAVHPSGQKAAVVIEGDRHDNGDPDTDIWILDFENGTRRALTNDGWSDYPAWSPSGDSLYFIATEGNDRLMVMATSGRGGVRQVLQTAFPALIDLAISPDGKMAVMGMSLPPIIDQSSSILVVGFEQFYLTDD